MRSNQYYINIQLKGYGASELPRILSVFSYARHAKTVIRIVDSRITDWGFYLSVLWVGSANAGLAMNERTNLIDRATL
jgi:hypothetical protein